MSSINRQEIENFAKDADKWWDEDGPFAPLHRINPVRLKYIHDEITAHFSKDDEKLFKKLKILDVGCGGGLVCEPMARLGGNRGGNITGIDADETAISVAKSHAEEQNLKITYKNTTAEELLKKEHGGYDVVLVLEIVEHVANVEEFVKTCVDLCRPGGLIIFSTLNRTAKSFALGIVAAEYILRWVPRGTHNWKQFLKPSEMARYIHKCNATQIGQKGLIYSPLEMDFKLSDKDFDVNYFITAEKNS